MIKRDVVKATLDGERPPYVPWSFSFTQEARERLVQHYGTEPLDTLLHNHFLGLGNGIGFFEDMGNERVRYLEALIPKYRGSLAFHGGLSTQKTLPFGEPDDVRAETRRLLSLGEEGSYILAPAHAVGGDVPLENMLAFIDEALSQPGFKG